METVFRGFFRAHAGHTVSGLRRVIKFATRDDRSARLVRNAVLADCSCRATLEANIMDLVNAGASSVSIDALVEY